MKLVGFILLVVAVWLIFLAIVWLFAKWRARHEEKGDPPAAIPAPLLPAAPLPGDRWVQEFGFLCYGGGLLLGGYGVLSLSGLGRFQTNLTWCCLIVTAAVVLMVIGWGIRHYRPASWYAGIIVALALLCWPPYGILFGLYGLWVLLREPVRRRFLSECAPWEQRVLRPRYVIPVVFLLAVIMIWSTGVRLVLLDSLGLLKSRTAFLPERETRNPAVHYDYEQDTLTLTVDGRTLTLGRLLLGGCPGEPILVEDTASFGIVWNECGGIDFQKFDRAGNRLYSVRDPDAHHAHANAILAVKPGILCVSNMEGVSGFGGPTVHLYDWATGERVRVISAGGGTLALSADEETLYVAGWLGCTAIPLTR